MLATGARPSHNADQRDMCGNLVFAAPNLKAQDISKYYKDSTFGVPPTDIERTYSPRSDVTIVRDNSFGVPHVYGATRPGMMLGSATRRARTACSSSTSCASSGAAS